MTKAQICQAISEKLEPNPWYGTIEPWGCSAKGFWIVDQLGYVYPLSYFDIENASARLLDHFISLKSVDEAHDFWFEVWDFLLETNNRKGSIVLAVCKRLGIDCGVIE